MLGIKELCHSFPCYFVLYTWMNNRTWFPVGTVGCLTVLDSPMKLETSNCYDWPGLTVSYLPKPVYYPIISWWRCRVVLTSSNQWGVMVTKLNVPADWKGEHLLPWEKRPHQTETAVWNLLSYGPCMHAPRLISGWFSFPCVAEWQVYLVLVGMFLASLAAFYILYENSDSFWNFPLGRDQPARPKIGAIFGDPQPSDDQNMIYDLGPMVDMWERFRRFRPRTLVCV